MQVCRTWVAVVAIVVVCVYVVGCGGGDSMMPSDTSTDGQAVKLDAVSITVTTGTVKGRVIDIRGGAGIAGATVQVAGLADVTDQNGAFALNGVATGVQELAIQADGYKILGNTVNVIVREASDFVGDIVMTSATDAAAPDLPEF